MAFISQSGALLTSLIDRADVEGLAFSKIVSLGNKADLSEVAYTTAFKQFGALKVEELMELLDATRCFGASPYPDSAT